jgi:hypothetical protein
MYFVHVSSMKNQKAGNPENVPKLAKIKTAGLYRFGRGVCRFDTALFFTVASVPKLELRHDTSVVNTVVKMETVVKNGKQSGLYRLGRNRAESVQVTIASQNHSGTEVRASVVSFGTRTIGTRVFVK